MPYSEVTGRYYQTDSDEFPRSISWQQLFVLHVAANYKLLRSKRLDLAQACFQSVPSVAQRNTPARPPCWLA